MKIKSFISLLIIFCLISSVTVNVSAHYDTAYWNEGKRAQTRSGWMDWLPNDRKLSELSLPGTHDSMAWRSNLVGADITRTQTTNLYEQLISGIRAIDIRVKCEGNSFPTHHGIVYLGEDFGDVLKTIRTFLTENPTEAVFMRFSQEASSASDLEMKRVFDIYYKEYGDIFYKGSSQNPTVGEVRGKLVFLSNVLSLNGYGINYRNIYTQDDYHLNTNWDLYSKWEKIKVHLNTSDDLSDRDVIYMNYLSGSGGSFPYFVASGHVSPGTGAARLATGLTEPGFRHSYPDFPRVNWFGVFATIAFEGTNTLTADYLNKHKISRSGIVMADFPGERLINAIIDCNLRYN